MKVVMGIEVLWTEPREKPYKRAVKVVSFATIRVESELFYLKDRFLAISSETGGGLTARG